MYAFAGLAPGHYHVVAQAPAGYWYSGGDDGTGGGTGGAGHSATDLARGRTACFEVGAGETVGGRDVGMHQPPETREPTRGGTGAGAELEADALALR